MHTSVEKGGIWVSFRGKVYDITEFAAHHPGGDKILLAAGADTGPFWAFYSFHLDDEVLNMMKDYYIGELEQTDADEESDSASSPYADDPERHPALITVSKEPRNAETPPYLIPDQSVTPNELFFVRNHMPVPETDEQNHELELKIPNSKSKTIDISFKLKDLKCNFPKHTFVSTIVCAGNRRSGMAKTDSQIAERTGRSPIIRGLDWNHAAISTAEWTGVRLIDLFEKHFPIKRRGSDVSESLLNRVRRTGVKHVQFEGEDTDVTGEPYGSSLPIEWALDPEMDVLIAYEMNGQPIPRDHGYPLRVIVPGSIGARQVKWLNKITLSEEESESFYQRKDYKVAHPSADGSPVDYDTLPAILDHPVQSAICEPFEGEVIRNKGVLKVRGYALSGGGRGIFSVRVSPDGGQSWYEAQLHPVSPPAGDNACDGDVQMTHRTRKQWAWTLWEIEIPVPDKTKGMQLVCFARDSSNAVQPENADAFINVRGLLNNAWHRVNIRFD